MSCNWPTVTVEEIASESPNALATGPFGSAISSKFFTDSGVPVIRGSNLSTDTGVRLKDEGIVFVSEEKAKEFSRSVARVGDLVFTCWGTINQVGYIDGTSNWDEYIISNKQMKLTVDTTKVDPRFLYYVFSSPLKQREILSNGIGAAIPGFNLGQLRKHTFQLPPLLTQSAISDILELLDKKANKNAQINQTLEEMAQAIFKSWFVDFDPVKAKMNGEQPEGMDADTASLFPDKLIESELGLIPEGWEVQEAKKQLDVLRGFSYKGQGLVSSIDEGILMHNLNSVLEGGGYKYSGLKYYSEEVKDKFDIKEGDVLVANTEQGHNHLLIGYGAMVPKHLAHGFFSHHTFRVRPTKNSNITPEFIEQLFGKGRFVRQVQGFTNGTTVNMLPVAGMEMPQFVVPPKALAQNFTKLVKPMKAMIEENHKTNIELAKLRDTLLPKLLSDEITLD
ncbi:restriction endonuclease subunit S [Photobacterium sp. 53610]|uniref:restriction endonuclease subunit S n=1 Tax=Photobacterium sp. 53610 TaxID=3102789 RepID=UPI002EDAAD53